MSCDLSLHAALFGAKHSIDNDLMSRKEAARYLGVSERTLAIWASNKRYALSWFKVGRLAKYRRADLDAFLESRIQS